MRHKARNVVFPELFLPHQQRNRTNHGILPLDEAPNPFDL
jgi:hypothetical protein